MEMSGFYIDKFKLVLESWLKLFFLLLTVTLLRDIIQGVLISL